MNAFGQWLEARGLRNADVARALGLSPNTTLYWTQPGYWPRRRDVALRIIRFSGGAVTPDMLLPMPDRDSIKQSHEAALGREAIRTAKERERRNGKKAKASVVKENQIQPRDAAARRRAGA
jgi:uncharacterized protein YjcR